VSAKADYTSTVQQVKEVGAMSVSSISCIAESIITDTLKACRLLATDSEAHGMAMCI
jgi:hypothetical protein